MLAVDTVKPPRMARNIAAADIIMAARVPMRWHVQRRCLVRKAYHIATVSIAASRMPNALNHTLVLAKASAGDVKK